MQSRVLIVEDHPLVRLGLSYSLASHPRLAKCGEADSESKALALIERVQPDAVIVDLTLSDGAGLELIKRLRQRRLPIAIIVSSMHDRCVYEQRSLNAGANAYVAKDSGADVLMSAVVDAVDTLQRGGGDDRSQACSNTDVCDATTRDLTDRELEVFRMIGRGRSTRQIAAELFRSVKTIEAFRAKLKKKLDLSSSEELVRDAVRWVYENDAA